MQELYPCFDPTEEELGCSELERQVTGLGKPAGYYAVYNQFGFYTDFSSDSSESAAQIRHLRDNSWIDGFTRAVALKWTVYNVWDKRFYSIILLCESPSMKIKKCSFDIQFIMFPGRSFLKEIDD